MRVTVEQLAELRAGAVSHGLKLAVGDEPGGVVSLVEILDLAFVGLVGEAGAREGWTSQAYYGSQEQEP